MCKMKNYILWTRNAMVWHPLLGLIDQILGDPRQILDPGFNFSFCEVGTYVASRVQR